MDRLSLAQGLQIIHLYYENQRFTKTVFRALRLIYGRIIGLPSAQFAILLKNLKPNFHYWIIRDQINHI